MMKAKQKKQKANQKNLPLTDQALAYLRDAIQSQQIKPGQEIDFIALAKELGMSRTPIRESIRQLVTEGLFELKQGGSVCVTQLSAEEGESFYLVRDKLEVAAGRAAAIHISGLEIEMLRSNLTLFDNAHSEPDTLSHIDNQFHELLYDACNNSYLSQELKLLRIKIGLLMGRPFSNPARIDNAYKEHLSIVKALETHNPDLVEKAVSNHYLNARKSRLSLL
jgi:DNA-binding GntR family transcriptional regulator